MNSLILTTILWLRNIFRIRKHSIAKMISTKPEARIMLLNILILLILLLLILYLATFIHLKQFFIANKIFLNWRWWLKWILPPFRYILKQLFLSHTNNYSLLLPNILIRLRNILQLSRWLVIDSRLSTNCNIWILRPHPIVLIPVHLRIFHNLFLWHVLVRRWWSYITSQITASYWVRQFWTFIYPYISSPLSSIVYDQPFLDSCKCRRPYARGMKRMSFSVRLMHIRLRTCFFLMSLLFHYSPFELDYYMMYLVFVGRLRCQKMLMGEC